MSILDRWPQVASGLTSVFPHPIQSLFFHRASLLLTSSGPTIGFHGFLVGWVCAGLRSPGQVAITRRKHFCFRLIKKKAEWFSSLGEQAEGHRLEQ